MSNGGGTHSSLAKKAHTLLLEYLLRKVLAKVSSSCQRILCVLFLEVIKGKVGSLEFRLFFI